MRVRLFMAFALGLVSCAAAAAAAAAAAGRSRDGDGLDDDDRDRDVGERGLEGAGEGEMIRIGRWMGNSPRYVQKNMDE